MQRTVRVPVLITVGLPRDTETSKTSPGVGEERGDRWPTGRVIHGKPIPGGAGAGPWPEGPAFCIIGVKNP